MRRAICLTAASLALLGSASWGVGPAKWPADTTVNVPLTQAGNNQNDVDLASDGAGGAIAVWEDYRGGGLSLLYGQRVSGDGIVQWLADGVLLSTESSNHWRPVACTDGANGAIVAWQDQRPGAQGIYAQRVDGDSNVLWAATGEPIGVANGSQDTPQVVPDGAGGAIITWNDERSGGTDVYVQRVDKDGNALWTANGVALTSLVDDEYDPRIAPDGSGGAVVVWEDDRGAGVFAQRVNAAGVPQWTANGVAVRQGAAVPDEPRIAHVGAAVTVIAWCESVAADDEVYAQQLDAAGSPQWGPAGLRMSAAAGRKRGPDLVPDGGGGAIVAWDHTLPGGGRDVHAQRVDAGGNLQWTANGLPLCQAAGDQVPVRLVTAGQGGAICVWRDRRDGNTAPDIYAQRVDADGKTAWTTDGVPVTDNDDDQDEFDVVSDGNGGVVAAWRDRRGPGEDIYAQGLSEFGTAADGPMCTIGSNFTLTGAGFGTKKPTVYALYERKPGKLRKVKAKVEEWTDTEIMCTWKKRVPAGDYPLEVQPKRRDPMQVGSITIVSPVVDAVAPGAAAAQAVVEITGTYFGTKKPKVQIEYVNKRGKTKRKNCRLVKKSWSMDPDNGESSLDFVVPKLPAGAYDLFVVSRIAETKTAFTIQ